MRILRGVLAVSCMRFCARFSWPLLRAASVLAVGCAFAHMGMCVCCACACELTFPVFVGFTPGVQGGRPPFRLSRFLSLFRRGVGHARVRMLALQTLSAALPPFCLRRASGAASSAGTLAPEAAALRHLRCCCSLPLLAPLALLLPLLD